MLNSNNKPKPPFKWAGGKTSLLNQLNDYLPETIETYCEPFLGGGAIFCHVADRITGHAVLSDTNKALVGVYRNIKDNPKEIIERANEFESDYNLLSSLESKKKDYLLARESFNAMKSNIPYSMTCTILFLFLNKAGFNGLYRENKSGGFNVPFGKREKIKLVDEQNIEALSLALNKTNAIIQCASFESAFQLQGKKVFWYLDPPYVPVSNTSNFTEYQAGGFGAKNQMALLDLLNNEGFKGKFMLSNAMTEETKAMYSKFRCVEVSAKRKVSAKTEGRGDVKEIMVMNYE